MLAKFQFINKKLINHCKFLLKDCFKDPNCKNLFYGIGIIGSLGVGLNTIIPLILKKLVDSLSFFPNDNITFFLLVSYGLMWGFSQLSFYGRSYLSQRIEQRLLCLLEAKILHSLYNLPYQYFINQKPGGIINVIKRVQRSIPLLTIGLFLYILPLILEFFAVFFLILSQYSIFYFFIIGLTLFPFILCIIFYTPSLLKSREEANKVSKEVDGKVTDFLINREIINTFGQQENILKLCQEQFKNREVSETIFINELNKIYVIQTFILSMGFIVTTYFIGKDVQSGYLQVSDFIFFNGYLIQFIIPITVLGEVIQNLKKAIIDVKELIEILLVENLITEPENPTKLREKDYPLTFQNVSFYYEKLTILDNISFHVTHGTNLYIVGPSGAGKSTISKLILRLYNPVKGRILIQNVDIKELSFKCLYNIVSCVPQEINLFHDTIKNNFLILCPQATTQDIEEALDKANLLSFVKSLPEGINTSIGSKGLKLSGGQKQRIALAYIFLKRPKICIFDESNSFLDEKNNSIIQENIQNFLPHTTKIIITHRPFKIDPLKDILFKLSPFSEKLNPYKKN